MSYETLDYQVEDGILTLTLNRPDRMNAFNGAMRRELIAAFDAADADDAVRVIIMTGAGKAFCAGLIWRRAAIPSTATSVRASRKATSCVMAAAPFHCVSTNPPSRLLALLTAQPLALAPP